MECKPGFPETYIYPKPVISLLHGRMIYKPMILLNSYDVEEMILDSMVDLYYLN